MTRERRLSNDTFILEAFGNRETIINDSGHFLEDQEGIALVDGDDTMLKKLCSNQDFD